MKDSKSFQYSFRLINAGGQYRFPLGQVFRGQRKKGAAVESIGPDFFFLDDLLAFVRAGEDAGKMSLEQGARLIRQAQGLKLQDERKLLTMGFTYQLPEKGETPSVTIYLPSPKNGKEMVKMGSAQSLLAAKLTLLRARARQQLSDAEVSAWMKEIEDLKILDSRGVQVQLDEISVVGLPPVQGAWIKLPEDNQAGFSVATIKSMLQEVLKFGLMTELEWLKIAEQLRQAGLPEAPSPWDALWLIQKPRLDATQGFPLGRIMSMDLNQIKEMLGQGASE